MRTHVTQRTLNKADGFTDDHPHEIHAYIVVIVRTVPMKTNSEGSMNNHGSKKHTTHMSYSFRLSLLALLSLLQTERNRVSEREKDQHPLFLFFARHVLSS